VGMGAGIRRKRSAGVAYALLARGDLGGGAGSRAGPRPRVIRNELILPLVSIFRLA
jgi:hypothetical protein